MTDEEAWSYLEEGRRAQLCTNGADGWPHVVPLSYFVDGRALVFWTDGQSRKVRNIRRDDRVSCLVEAGDGIEEYRAVQIQGQAELVDEYGRSLTCGKTLFERYAGGALDDNVEAYVAMLAHQRTVVTVRPVRLISWDHRKMNVDLRTIGS